MGTALGPLHLLALDHALADHLIDRRFREGCRDRLAVAVALSVVRNEAAVVVDVAVEFLDNASNSKCVQKSGRSGGKICAAKGIRGVNSGGET
jgi:hypothetical protein